MRIAISAVAAVSGLLLLMLAFYGQPAVYLHQARQQWDQLIDAPVADQPAEPERDADADREARLQQQVAQLENELAAQQAPASPPQAAQPAAPAAAPQPQVPQPGDRQAELAKSAPMQAAPVQAAPVQAAPVQAAPVQAAPVRAAPVQAAPAQVATQQAPMPQIAMPQAPMPRTPMPQTEAVLPDQPTQGVPAIPIPQRNEFAVTGQIAPRPEPAKPGSARAEADPSEAAKAEPNRAEPGKPAAQKFVALKPVPSPPPLPKTPPPRQAQDPAQSVLARLRQMAPASPPAQPVAIPLPPADPRPRAAPSPSLPKLTAARAALASGRVEDARRLLQEVQLQLVFRPVNGGGDEAPSAGKGAADVAHALEALSGNDMPLSRRYIDVALDDLSGSGTIAPVQETQIRPSGYAPAYPPR